MFGLPKPQESTSYSGSDSYRFVERLMRNQSRTLKIVTPFLSPYYAKMLLELARKKRIYVIVAGGADKGNGEAIRMLSGGRRGINGKLALCSIGVGVVFAYLNYYWVTVLAALLFIAIVYFGTTKRRVRNLSLKAARGRFIHEKLYITEGEAITGSANLTYAGMHKNIEHIDVIKDRRKIDELSRHFDQLWSGI